jgi:hypothetical protein
MKKTFQTALAVTLALLYSQSPAAAAEKIKFKNADGKEIYIIKPKDDGYKLVDGNQKLLARYKFKDTRLKIKNADGKEIAMVSGDSTKLKIKVDKRTAYFIKAQAKGAYKVKDGDENTLYKLKPKDYGFKIKNGAEKVIAKTKKKGEKIVFESAKGVRQYTTKAKISLLAASCVGFTKIPLEMRIGMMLQLAKKQ